MTASLYSKAVVIVGIGQMGGVFARAFLGAGRPVYPVTAHMSMADAAGACPDPDFVLLAVPENVLSQTLARVPEPWQNRLGLLQNELLPGVWEAAGIANPTAMAVWFEKKKGRGVHVFQPTQVYGPHAGLVKTALNTVDIPCDVLPDSGALATELIKKNLYVLTINIAGLVTGGTTGELWAGHRKVALAVADDVLTVLAHVSGRAVDRNVMKTFLGDILTRVPDHTCRGRVAEDRLARIMTKARQNSLETPALVEVSERILRL